MSFATLEDIVRKFDWPDAAKKDAVNFFDALPSSLKAGVLGTTVAFTWAGLATGIIKRPSRIIKPPDTTAVTNHPLATGPLTYETFRLQALSSAVNSELSLWKAFHSIDAELVLYCDYIFQRTKSPGNRKLPDMIHLIRRDFATLMSDRHASRFPDFYSLSQKLHENGSTPLLMNVQSLLGSGFAGPSVEAERSACARLIARKYYSVREWKADLGTICDFLNQQSEALIEQLRNDDTQSVVRDFVRTRQQAANSCISFSVAVSMAGRFLGLQSARGDIPDGIYKELHELLGFIHENLAHGMSQRVVNLSNDVIFKWIDILNLTKDDSR